MARKEGLGESGTFSCKYCPARVYEEAMSGASDTSMETWKRDSAAGSMREIGDGVNRVVSCRTAEATTENKRRLLWRRSGRVRWRKKDMERVGRWRWA